MSSKACKKRKSIEYKKYNAKIINTKIKAYPDTGAYTSSIPRAIVNKYDLKPKGFIYGILMNGRLNKLMLYDVPLTFMGRTVMIRAAAMEKQTSEPIMFVGRKQLRQFCVQSVKV